MSELFWAKPGFHRVPNGNSGFSRQSCFTTQDNFNEKTGRASKKKTLGISVYMYARARFNFRIQSKSYI